MILESTGGGTEVELSASRKPARPQAFHRSIPTTRSTGSRGRGVEPLNILKGTRVFGRSVLMCLRKKRFSGL